MKNYLIIGASSGIGKALADSLSQEAKVFGTYNGTSPSLQNVSYHQMNILEDSLDFSFLPESVDGIAYCPGSINLKPFTRIKPRDFLADYQLQVLGAIKVLQANITRLKKSSSASVVLFSTVAVQQGFPFHAQVAASKGAIEGLTRSLAAELAPSIRVNCIAPSLTNTPLAANLLNKPEKIEANDKRHPLKRIGTPEDIAQMAEFLLSDASSWVSGQIFAVDGGMSSLKI